MLRFRVSVTGSSFSYGFRRLEVDELDCVLEVSEDVLELEDMDFSVVSSVLVLLSSLYCDQILITR